ncbi:MAG: hypothetical protein DSZ27_06270 [Thiomicrospira sp.]|nr:MAG: hypothetical protein DSZ27_06270 [Thiomicrospira sp.]
MFFLHWQVAFKIFRFSYFVEISKSKWIENQLVSGLAGRYLDRRYKAAQVNQGREALNSLFNLP